MPRRPSIWYKQSHRCWFSTALGGISPKTGRRLGKANYEIGPPTGRDGAANEARARLWLESELAAEAEAGRTEADPTLGDLARLYLEWCQARGLAASTVRGYCERLRAFASFHHDGRLYDHRLARDFRPADLRRVVKAMRAEGCASVWIRDVSAAARACFTWAARPIDDRIPERILRENPFADVEGVKVEAPPKRYAGAEVRAKFFRYATWRALMISDTQPLARRFDALFLAMCRFIEATGCRPDEACRLEWSHVDWTAGIATLRGKSTSATGKNRRVPIPPETLRMLRAVHRLPERHEAFVFTHERRAGGNPTLEGVPWNSNAFGHKFGDWRDEAIAAMTKAEGRGLADLTPYQLRRDLGADILRMTGSYAASAEVPGHSAAMNERHYSSFEDELAAVDLAAAVAASRRQGPG